MPRQSKSKSDAPEGQQVSNTPVVEQTTTSADKSKVVAKQPKENKSKTPKVETAPTPAPVQTPSNVASSNDQPAEDGDSGDLVAQANEFLTKLNQVGALFASLKSEFRSLEKKWSREIKTAQKSQAKRKRKSGNRQPSGFVKPTKISDELAKFLDKPKGTEMARTDVTREINTYIRAHKLQDKDNGRKINPDAKLTALLKLSKTDELTYFNLQRYMSPHFSKAEKTVSA